MLTRRSVLHGSGGLAGLAVTQGAVSRVATAATDPSPPRAPGLLRLIGNENPYGPSPGAKQAMAAAMDDGWMYDARHGAELAGLIAAREGLTPAHVVVTEGSTELLRVAGLAYGAGREVVAAYPTFPTLQIYARKNGGRNVPVPLDKDMRHDLAAMEAKITGDTGLIYICNPNNPTGTTIADPDRLRSFIDSVGARAMVLVDEAYIDFCDEPSRRSMVDRIKAGKNIIVARTFSKLHGLAGVRVGYGLAQPDTIKRLEEYRMSISNRMGLVAAIASYRDAQFQAESRKGVRAGIALVTEVLRDLGLPHTDSQTNFVFFDTGRPAAAFIAAMGERQILLPPPFQPYDTWCRISMGRLEEMPRVAEAIRASIRKRG